MRYRIEYADGRCCNFANSRKDLKISSIFEKMGASIGVREN